MAGFWDASGASRLPPVVCPASAPSGLLAIWVTHPPNHAAVAARLRAARRAGVPAIAFSDEEVPAAPIYRLDASHTGACTYRERSERLQACRWRPACNRTAAAAVCARQWHGNTRGDGKYLAALLALRVACSAASHRWYLLGDDDTFWCLPALRRALAPFDPSHAHYLSPSVAAGAAALDPRHGPPLPVCAAAAAEPCRTRFAGRPNPLAACPPLGPRGRVRLGPFSLGEDPSLARGDCAVRPAGERQEPWDVGKLRLSWPYGGAGVALSAGLLSSLPLPLLQACVDRIVHGGCDGRVAVCLGLHGVAPAQLGAEANLSSHRSASACATKLRGHVV